MKHLTILIITIALVFTNCKKENNVETDPNATISEVEFYTSRGNFVVQTEDKLAPITSKNFLKLVDQKFYDGIIFHRVIQNFIVQGGDPTGTGTGGPGYTIEDEFNLDLSNTEKTISMANTGAANSGGSQFFFNMTDNTNLDSDKSPTSSAHAVFGKVISGWNVVENISYVAVNSSNKPIIDVTIDSIRKIN